MSEELSAEDLAKITEELSKAESKAAPVASVGKLKVFLDPTQLKKDLAYSEATVGEATMQQAALFASYAAMAAKADHQADSAKNALEIVEAEVDRDLRNEAAASGTKITEASISKAIVLDDRYQTAQKRHTDAKLIASLCAQAREAFKQRMFMLIQSGKDQVIERQGEIRTLVAEASRNQRESLIRELAQ